MSFIQETCRKGHSYSWSGDDCDRGCTVCAGLEEVTAEALLAAAKNTCAVQRLPYLEAAIDLYEAVRS